MGKLHTRARGLKDTPREESAQACPPSLARVFSSFVYLALKFEATRILDNIDALRLSIFRVLFFLFPLN